MKFCLLTENLHVPYFITKSQLLCSIGTHLAASITARIKRVVFQSKLLAGLQLGEVENTKAGNGM